MNEKKQAFLIDELKSRLALIPSIDIQRVTRTSTQNIIPPDNIVEMLQNVAFDFSVFKRMPKEFIRTHKTLPIRFDRDEDCVSVLLPHHMALGDPILVELHQLMQCTSLSFYFTHEKVLDAVLDVFLKPKKKQSA